MTPTGWADVKRILSDAIQLPREQRPAHISVACAGNEPLLREVESLLGAYEADPDFLEAHPPAAEAVRGAMADHISAAVSPNPPGTIGPYRILEKLGRGGMGEVYLAVRDDGVYQQQVAIKLVQPDKMNAFVLERFRQERQLLAFMSHPYIARMLDGGTTPDGRPYLVMEYAHGLPLLDYCAGHNLPRLARIRLFLQICEAVAHAHRNLIVHRDLKPQNIVVDGEGKPKLLDFGIAKLLLPNDAGLKAAQTRDVMLLTPEYASPEQFRGEHITTASDVYSLGSILYELLSGRKAHRFLGASMPELHRVICQEDPAPPSDAVRDDPPHETLTPEALRGDLDRIVLQALHKDPERRYSSVEQLSEDLRRYLGGLPVQAQGDSLRYRAAKFVQRNRGAVIAGALAVAMLIGGIITTSWQARQARIERDRAERRFHDVRRLAASFLVENDVLAQLPGGTAVRTKLIERSLEYLNRLASEASGDLELQRELALAYEKMGDVQGRADGPNLGDTAGALTSYRQALSIREAIAKEQPWSREARRDIALALSRLSGAVKIAGNYREGLELDRRALAIRLRLHEEAPENRSYRRELAENYTTLGGSLFQVGQWKEVWPAREKARLMYLELTREAAATAADWRGLSLAHSRMASLLHRERQNSAAEREYRLALAAARHGYAMQRPGPQFRQLEATALNGLGGLHADAGRYTGALASYRAALAIYEAQAKADPQDVRAGSFLAAGRFRIGRVLLRQGAARRAMGEFRISLQLREALAARNPMNAGARGELAESLGALGDAYVRLGSFPQASASYRRAISVLESLQEAGRANSASLAELKRLRAELAKLPRPAASLQGAGGRCGRERPLPLVVDTGLPLWAGKKRLPGKGLEEIGKRPAAEGGWDKTPYPADGNKDRFEFWADEEAGEGQKTRSKRGMVQKRVVSDWRDLG